ncbi:toll-like receptor 13 [Xyrichtys novacula]|uniref:Toll-like receptor 13 n=1 Tax=Xyrichtys novacula TaxID=13765 RepID=A0AAV1HHV1_XYRNO|nr:toll-like receptor 13 [Xyrichtys novacula]
MLHRFSFFISLLTYLLQSDPSLAYSLKNCTVEYTKYVGEVPVVCSDRDLTSVPVDIPKNATSLDLNSNSILTINRTELSRLWKLRNLQIESNSLSHIVDRAFEDLVQLTQLLLGSNHLTTLADGMFQGLSKLEDLSVEKNQITCISPLAFQPLASLKKVDLCYNELHEFTQIMPIFQLPKIEEVVAGMNRFTSFEFEDTSFNASNLKMLWFNANPLRKFSITRDIFPNLESLDLSKCLPGFEWKVTDKVFLRSLKKLYLSGTEVSFETHRAIFQSAFAVEYLWLSYVTDWLSQGLLKVACQMPALKDLDLTFNDIHVLNDTLLQPCSMITDLALTGNVMTDLSDRSLRSLNRLETLSLDHNFLPQVPSAVRGLSTLVVLDLSSNDIGELHCLDFQNLTGLVHLYLDDNRISILRGCAFQDLKTLTKLNIQSNQVFALHDTFQVSLPNLRFLNMRMNKFVNVDKYVFKGIPHLYSLDLQTDRICLVENNSFVGLSHLKTLVLSAHTLDKDIFRGMPNLASLTLFLPAGNALSQQANKDPPFLYVPLLETLTIHDSNRWTMVIPRNLLKGLWHLQQFAAVKFFTGTPHTDLFSDTPNLTRLQITSSHIWDPKPELLKPLAKLETLDLSKNKLRSLDFLARANLSALRWLNLGDNELTVINETVFQSLPALTYLDLYGNPFTCSCLNQGFIQWVKNNSRTQVVNAYHYDCYFPPGQQGNRLLDFDFQSCKMDLDFLCFISSSSLVMLTILMSFIYHFLRWQIIYAFCLFLAFLYDSRKRKKETPHRYDAFISYNVDDEAWVFREMLPVLEGEQGWRLCLHHRDFQPGKAIIENIMDAIYSSRKTICVISRSYLESEWCSKEFQMASFRLFDEQKDVLILLFLEEIPDQQLSPYYRMRKLVKKRTYLSWPRAGGHTGVFWQNVCRALEMEDTPAEDSNLLTAGAAVDV